MDKELDDESGGTFAKSKSAATNKTGPPENSRRPQETAKNHREISFIISENYVLKS